MRLMIPTTTPPPTPIRWRPSALFPARLLIYLKKINFLSKTWEFWPVILLPFYMDTSNHFTPLLSSGVSVFISLWLRDIYLRFSFTLKNLDLGSADLCFSLNPTTHWHYDLGTHDRIVYATFLYFYMVVLLSYPFKLDCKLSRRMNVEFGQNLQQDISKLTRNNLC